MPDDEYFDPRDDPNWVLIAELDQDGAAPGLDRLRYLGRIADTYWFFDDQEGWEEHKFGSDADAASYFGLDLL